MYMHLNCNIYMYDYIQIHILVHIYIQNLINLCTHMYVQPPQRQADDDADTAMDEEDREKLNGEMEL